MAGENTKPLIDEPLYKEIRQRFALPKNSQGKLNYVSLYEHKEPILAEKLKALTTTISSAYETDLVNSGMSVQGAQKLSRSLGKELYSVAWYGYMFAEKAKDVTWERDMRSAWEKDYTPPTYNPNEKEEDEGEDCAGSK